MNQLQQASQILAEALAAFSSGDYASGCQRIEGAAAVLGELQSTPAAGDQLLLVNPKELNEPVYAEAVAA